MSSQHTERSAKSVQARRAELKRRLTTRLIAQQEQRRSARLSEARLSGEEPPERCDHDQLVSFGVEAGLDVSDPGTLDYLLELEEEIYRERCWALYEQSHSNGDDELEEYYRSLTS